MTQDFDPAVADQSYVNIYGSTLVGSYAERLSPPGFRERPLLRNNKLYRIAIPWELTLDDFRGQQAQVDKYEKSYAGWSQSTADLRFRGYLFSPVTTTRDTQAFASSAGDGPVVWCDAGTLGTVVAQGSTANQCLAVANVSVTPAPNYKTYTPGSAISCLMAGPLNSTLSLLVGRTSATIDVHTTVGTSAGTMSASLNPAWGGALSPLNATTPGLPTWLFYANAGIWSLASNVAIGTAPTQVLSGLNNGGCVLGFETLEKSPLGNRMYLLIPKAPGLTVSAWHTRAASPSPCLLFSVNEEGTDLQQHQLPLNGVLWARLWQRKVVVSDGSRVLAFDGAKATDLNIFGAPSLNTTNVKPLCVGLGGDDSSLIATTYIRQLSDSAFAIQRWEYSEDLGDWSPISAKGAIISSLSVSDASPYVLDNNMLCYGPNLPYSRANAYNWTCIYNSANVTWDYQFSWPRGVNPQLLGTSKETSGVHLTPKWTLPGTLAGHPFVIEEIDARQVDIDAGGSTATVQVEVATEAASTSLSFTNGLTRTFAATEAIRGRYQRFDNNVDALHRLYARVTTAVSSGGGSPNGANVVLRGISFLDNVVRSPNQVRGTQ